MTFEQLAVILIVFAVLLWARGYPRPPRGW
jgi:hypothetical protein